MTKFTLPLLLIALAATAPAAPVAPPPREAAFYFPTTVGAKWSYTEVGERPEGSEPFTVFAASVEPAPLGAKLVTLVRVMRDGKTRPHDKVEVSDRGLFSGEGRDARLPADRPCVLKLPHRAGQSWAYAPSDGSDSKLTAHGPEWVEVPAGLFACLRVDYWDDLGSDKPWMQIWYARGVGRVKYVRPITGQTLVVVLKSFTPGKD